MSTQPIKRRVADLVAESVELMVCNQLTKESNVTAARISVHEPGELETRLIVNFRNGNSRLYKIRVSEVF